jgi:hypothetical protein
MPHDWILNWNVGCDYRGFCFETRSVEP